MRSEARGKVFERIEVIDNPQKLHSTLGDLPPALYESIAKAS
jgi:hypothetical protein